MSVNAMYKSNNEWLKAEDLKGNAIKVVIANSGIEEFDNGKKIVLGFKGKDKKLVLNKTNANVIASVYGDEEMAWIDREIIMYPTVTEFGGNSVPCIRVRIEAEVISDQDCPF